MCSIWAPERGMRKSQGEAFTETRSLLPGRHHKPCDLTAVLCGKPFRVPNRRWLLFSYSNNKYPLGTYYMCCAGDFIVLRLSWSLPSRLYSSLNKNYTYTWVKEVLQGFLWKQKAVHHLLSPFPLFQRHLFSILFSWLCIYLHYL